jgi:hypothetical protein
VDSQKEYTLSLPWRPGTQNVALLDDSGNRLANLDVSSLSSSGDAVGPVPKESIASSSGQSSVQNGLQAAQGPSASSGRTGSSAAAAVGGCPLAVLLAALALLAYLLL